MSHFRARFGVGLASLTLAMAVSAEAAAFCASRSCRPKLEQCETRGDDPRSRCVVSGNELFRKSSCVTFNVQEDGSLRHGIDAQTFEQVVRDAFDRWLTADCGDGLHPSIAVESLGTVSCREPQYNCAHGNANIFLFEDEAWLDEDTIDPFALTTVWFIPSTGEIRDVDVEVNGTLDSVDWAAPREGVDLPSILTHEVGHFLGMAHSPDEPRAVMRPNFNPGTDDLRVLTPDDLAGICHLYPPDRQASTNECGPRNGLASDCGPGDGEHCSFAAESGCCSTAPGRPDPLGFLALSAFTAAAAIGRARRRKWRSG